MTGPLDDSNLDGCITSAQYWIGRLPKELHKVTVATRGFTVAAMMVSAITSVGVWPIISQSSELWAQSVTSAITFLAAVLAGWPVALAYTERKKALIGGTQKMGYAFGHLLDAKKGQYDKSRAIDEFHEAWNLIETLGLRVEEAKKLTATPELFRTS